MQKFLKFQLDREDRGLLTAESVKEAIAIDLNNILPVPEVPDYILGIYSWRGEIIWAIDLPHLLGYPAVNSETSIAAIVRDRENTLALIVPDVNEIIERDLDLLQHNVEEIFSQPHSFYLAGYFIESNNTCLCTLDFKAIISETSS